MEWLVLRIEALQNLTLLTASLLLILLPKGNVPPGNWKFTRKRQLLVELSKVLVKFAYPALSGLVGLSLSYACMLTGTHVFVTQWYCHLSNYIISVERIYIILVERIKQFMHIPSEPASILENHRPPSSWPSKGRIELQELQELKVQIALKIRNFYRVANMKFFSLLGYS